jgi:hypothetical protein
MEAVRQLSVINLAPWELLNRNLHYRRPFTLIVTSEMFLKEAIKRCKWTQAEINAEAAQWKQLLSSETALLTENEYNKNINGSHFHLAQIIGLKFCLRT